MKIRPNKNLKLVFINFLLAIAFTINASAQGPGDPPPPPGDHGYSSHQNSGGNAPLGGGVAILIISAAAYALRKLYSNKKKSLLD
jgi:hypothetical protein